MSAAESVVAQIQHYQKSIQKSHGNSKRILHCITRLYSLPVTVQHLQDTGVGKTINSLRKSDGQVGESARALVAKWKQMVEEESENEQENNTHVHSDNNGVLESDNHREKSNTQSKENYMKAKDCDLREHSRSDISKSQKRSREFESDLLKEKRLKGDKFATSSSHNSLSYSNIGGKLNGNSDDEWNIGGHSRKLESEDEHDLEGSELQIDRDHFEEQIGQLSDNDFHNGEYLTPSHEKELWQRKEEDKSSRKEKSSSLKHKHKSSSSNSEKSKHSSSGRSEQKDSKSSSSSKHRDEKVSSSGSSSNTYKKETLPERSENKGKAKVKEKKEKHKDKHWSKDVRKSKEKKDKEKKADEDGVDSNSGKSFGEALGMMFPPDKPKKKSSSGGSLSQSPSKKKCKSSSTEKKSEVRSDSNLSPEVEPEYSAGLLPSLEVDEDFGLPALNPNYKPLPPTNLFNSPPKRYQTDDDDLSNIMYSKVQRTKVFSGNKTGYTYVPSLFDLCTRVLQENIDALEYTGGVPFDLLKPVLERATADQLFTLEHYNAYLIEDTDIFWEYHCKKDFRNKRREEMETWREMYMRCRDEREVKLKSLTANIAASSKAKALPLRKTQLAYIESSAKPPRNIARKQAKFGTGQASASAASKQDSASLSSSFTGRSNSAHATGPAVAVPVPRGAGGSSHSSSCKPKPKAPLMQKALQLIRHNRFKR